MKTALLTTITILTLLGCRDADRVTIHTGEAMGTSYRIKVAGDARIDTPAIDSMFAQFDRDLSTWRDDSWVAGFNRAPAGTTLEMPATVATLIELSQKFHQQTEGRFDPTIGALIRLWGFGAWRGEWTRDPTEAEITAAREASGFHNLRIDGHQITKLHSGLMLDFSGIAKGHAVDIIGKMLEESGQADFIIDIGGDILARGNAPGREGWRVAGPSLDAPVTLHNEAIASSGSDHQFRDRHSHIIAPRSGRPVAVARAVAATAPTCAEADALATAKSIKAAESDR